jgi:hypothetical protein
MDNVQNGIKYWLKNSGKNVLFSSHSILSTWYDTDCLENTESNIPSIVLCVFVAAGKYLASRYLAKEISSGSIKPAFRCLWRQRKADGKMISHAFFPK